MLPLVEGGWADLVLFAQRLHGLATLEVAVQDGPALAVVESALSHGTRFKCESNIELLSLLIFGTAFWGAGQVEAATVVRQSMLNLSDPKLQILDVIFDPILAGTDGLQVFQGVVGNVIAHASIVTELERRGKFFHNVIIYLMGNSTMGCPKKHPKAIVQIFQIILANE